MRKIVMSLFLALLFPTIVTLAWTGSVGGREKRGVKDSGKKIILDRGSRFSTMDAE